MSFSVSRRDGEQARACRRVWPAAGSQRSQTEWGSNSLAGLLAQPANALSPRFLRMLATLPRFEADVLRCGARGRSTVDTG